MNVCLHIDGAFELFENVLANIHDKYSQKSKNKLLHFIISLFLKKMIMARFMILTPVSIISILWVSYKAN